MTIMATPIAYVAKKRRKNLTRTLAMTPGSQTVLLKRGSGDIKGEGIYLVVGGVDLYLIIIN